MVPENIRAPSEVSKTKVFKGKYEAWGGGGTQV